MVSPGRDRKEPYERRSRHYQSWSRPRQDRARARAQSRFAARIRRWERRYYDRITAPDLAFLLQVDPETAVARKKNEPADYVRQRAQLTWETDWSRSGARIIDAAQPLTQVVAALKSELWRTL